MVHSFYCLGRDFVLDTESGTLLLVSKAAKRIIQQKQIPHTGKSGDFLGCNQSKPVSNLNSGAEELLKSDSDLNNSSLNKGLENKILLEDVVDDKHITSCDDEILSEQEVNLAEQEVNQLISQGLLFSQPQKSAPQPYDGTVKSLCLNVSHNCNLRCKYCFAEGGSYNTKRLNMPLNVAKAAIDFLIMRSNGRKNLEVDFFGGEPLLNIDVVKQTVEYAKSQGKLHGKNFRFTITTNGVLLTEELIDYFNKEMYNVVISIDGRESVHNLVRPDANASSTFKQSLNAARLLKQKRGDKFYYIRGTFTSKNKDFALDALALNDFGFDQISLEPVVLPKEHYLALKEDDIPFLSNQYEILAIEYLKRRKSDKWFNFFHFMMDLQGGPCLKKRITGCGAGSEYLAISPDGGIYPCHRFDGKDQYLIGNVLDGTFDERLPKMFASCNVYTKDKCKDCFSKYYCSGGCAANSIEHAGDINNCYELGCQLTKKRTEVALAIFALENEDNSNLS